MQKILITGASGFLGGHVWWLARQQAEVFGLGHSHPPPHPAITPLELTDEESVKSCLLHFRPEVVIHAAAMANLDACEKNPEKAFAVNTEATAYLLKYSKELKVRFIFLSTDMVFDGRRGFYTESDEVSPLSVYARSKVAAEKYITENYDDYVIVRAALIYGRPRLGGTSFSQWLEDHLKKAQPVRLYVDQYRTPIWAGNLAEILLELAQNRFTGILHCGGTDRIDRFSFGRMLCRIVGYDASLLIPASMLTDHLPAPRPQDVSLCTALAASILKTPLLSCEQGLQQMIEQKNEPNQGC